MIRNILGVTVGATLALGLTGCDSKDSGGGGGGNHGEGSGTKTNAAIHGDRSVASANFLATIAPRLLVQGSGTKPAKPSGTKTDAPASGSGSKTNKPAGGSGLKTA